MISLLGGAQREYRSRANHLEIAHPFVSLVVFLVWRTAEAVVSVNRLAMGGQRIGAVVRLYMGCKGSLQPHQL